MTTIKDRVLYFAEYQEGNKQEFFRKTGLNYSNFTGKSKESDLNSKHVAKIILTYPEINPIWLILGEGEMMRKFEQKICNNTGTNQNNINGNIGGNISISQNDLTSIIEIQKEMNEIIKKQQDQLTESQKQIGTLISLISKLPSI